MNLDGLIFVPRTRKPWEAVDLGFRLVPKFWKPMLITWVALSLPIFVLCHLTDFGVVYASVILWWLKPLFERTQLYILSQGIFGTDVSWQKALNALPSYLFRQLFAALTWRRIGFSRSFDMPVVQLEMLEGDKRTNRLNILHRYPSNTATWLTIILVHIESVLLLGFLSLLALFVPESVNVSWIDLYEDQIWLVNLIYFVCIGLVGPFYVASGFMLYINRRIELEGWDIELKFKEIALANRRMSASANGSSQLSVFALGLVLAASIFGFQSDSAFAQPNSEDTNQLAQSYEQMNDQSIEETCSGDQCVHLDAVRQSDSDILAVFEHEDFHEETTVRLPRWLSELDDEEDSSNDLSGIPPWLVSVLQWLSVSIELILWVLMILVVVYLVYKNRAKLLQLIDAASSQNKMEFEAPTTMFGLDVRRENLPDDIEDACKSLIEAGNYRECLSLLYRATISKLIFDYQIPFSTSSTELECLRISKPHAPDEIFNYFEGLVQAWRRLAYGHLSPSREQLEVFSNSWNKVLNGSGQSMGQGNDD